MNFRYLEPLSNHFLTKAKIIANCKYSHGKYEPGPYPPPVYISNYQVVIYIGTV